MFRAAAPGPFDEAVAKATDENSTSEDWAAIIEVCDRVTADATNGPKEAVQSLIKRLAHRNANVQLYTLELANALSQNCGTPLHRELASRAFTDALLKLANDRNTHNLVRLKILERMKEWTEMFRSNTDLGIMQDAYVRLQQAQPQLQPPPSAPQKNSLTDLDRQREEEDLQRALKLSLEDDESKKVVGASGGASAAAAGRSAAGASSSGPAGPAEMPGASDSGAPPQGSTAATVSRVRALFDFAASEPDELDFKKGDVIAVLESVYRDWWRGSLKGRTGIFPLNYVEILADPSPDELQREAQMEAEVFAEIKNVEKLLTLLSASNVGSREEDSDEISTLAIRPKLIKLIEKYSQKKDDFTQLNEKFIKARRDYEALLESSMAHPPQHSYQQYAIRPQVQQQGYAAGPGGLTGYAAPTGPPDQRYYTPGPRQDQANFQRPGATATPVPFYLANSDVQSAQAAPQQQQSSQQQLPPQQQSPQQQQQQQQQQQAYLSQSQQHHRIPSGGNGGLKQPSPLQTNVSAQQPATSSYMPYHPQQAPMAGGPQSTHGNPQELSTSAYDSPVVSHSASTEPASAATYTSSVHSPDQFAPSGPTPGSPSPDNAPRLPTSYPAYVSYSHPPTAQAPYSSVPEAPTTATPAPPTTSPPPAPDNYYDARQRLPSIPASANVPAALSVPSAPPAPSAPSAPSGPSAPAVPGASIDQPQYRAYMPSTNAPTAPGGPVADDYYRRTGRVSY
ncbi:sh3 domain containing protein [Grosmannia clavigera kw1407]|uniref:Class E vacuolar protein-sorting machinery protein HSE1 n=1 Tax=Grosmannia clavigera (strain kw1407 / UAMH 11150) TaxID=655863 RepID=F0XCX4_GROCL|nr:sh3 domain containing protein [Grosmannia clavigera kw1407]EFX04633.1 sh3 domain containing protein [Grosmannia clavigera kw1407]